MTNAKPARLLPALLAVAGLITTGQPRPLSAAPAKDGATLTVVVSGARAGDGPIMASVFAGPTGFPLGPGATAIQLQPASGGAADRVVFRNLPPGRYAVAVHQDQVANRKMDLNFFGVPKEPWGVSQNVRPAFRPPHFDEAAFNLRGKTRIDVRIVR
jgi:hypothetical protein